MTTQIAPIVGPQARKSLLTIQKASLKKQLLSAEFSEQLDLQSNAREFTMQGKDLVHPDLETCFDLLVPHFCLLTEQLTETEDYWMTEDNIGNTPHFDNYGVTGLVLGAKNGVTLVGFRKLENGKVLNMTAQYVSFAEQSEEFTESDAWQYTHTEDLEQLVQQAITEIELALRGKCSDVGRQLKMFVEPEEVMTESGESTEATEPQKQSPTPRARKAQTSTPDEAPKSASRPRKKKEPVVAEEAAEPAA